MSEVKTRPLVDNHASYQQVRGVAEDLRNLADWLEADDNWRRLNPLRELLRTVEDDLARVRLLRHIADFLDEEAMR